MTASEQAVVSSDSTIKVPSNWLVFGTGLGVAIAGDNLDVVIAKARHSSAQVVAATTLANFRDRPAAEWGAEFAQFLTNAGQTHLAANVTLPREEVIVRSVGLPGVPDKEISAAVELQLETLHPYGDEDVVWAWRRVRPDAVLVGLVRKVSLDYWETLFAEAGVSVAAFTFSSAVIHASLRVWGAAPASLLFYSTNDQGRTEIYGESESRAVYSAELSIPAERALSAARAELRLDTSTAIRELHEGLPQSAAGSVIVYPALAWATALAASVPFSTAVANFLPKERRAANARGQYLLTAALGGLFGIGLLVAFLIFPAIERRNYLSALNEEIRRLEPAAKQAQALEQQTALAKNRIGTLDDIRRRSQADLDVLAELTRILPAQTWTNTIEIYPDSVVIAGETDQAAPLLKTLDSSPLFHNSEFALSVTRSSQTEQFRIKTMRRNRVGRTTP